MRWFFCKKCSKWHRTYPATVMYCPFCGADITDQDMNVIFNEVKASECQLVRTGQARRKGKASIEWYTEDTKPMYYCLGYTDKMTDELLPECNRCSKHVYKAQRDLEEYLKRSVK